MDGKHRTFVLSTLCWIIVSLLEDESMMNKTAAEKLGLAPAEERVFFSLEKPMPAPSQNLLEEGKEESRFDSFSSMEQTA